MRRGQTKNPDYERIARELVRALRGRRSCAELSRRAGYRSNAVYRWEAGHCWPTAARFLQLRSVVRPQAEPWIRLFLRQAPPWLSELDANSAAAVAAFLRHLRGKTPIVRIAEIAQRNRFTVSRWFEGRAEPNLPDFLRLVDACSRRLPDIVAALEDPARVPAIEQQWRQQQLAREAAYARPWSHAVLRALELDANPQGLREQERFIASKLGIGSDEVRDALRMLEALAQVRKVRGRYRPRVVTTIDTGGDPARARALRVSWTSTAMERLRADAPGWYVWNLFAVSKADLMRLRELQLHYFRAMREVIASSAPNECVGLYCAQLLDLGGEGIGVREIGEHADRRKGRKRPT